MKRREAKVILATQGNIVNFRCKESMDQIKFREEFEAIVTKHINTKLRCDAIQRLSSE